VIVASQDSDNELIAGPPLRRCVCLRPTPSSRLDHFFNAACHVREGFFSVRAQGNASKCTYHLARACVSPRVQHPSSRVVSWLKASHVRWFAPEQDADVPHRRRRDDRRPSAGMAEDRDRQEPVEAGGARSRMVPLTGSRDRGAWFGKDLAAAQHEDGSARCPRILLGTAAYMAPEQARGKAVDRRADSWAFGCVLYEMLTGRRAFDGDDISTTLAAVIRADAEWSAVPIGHASRSATAFATVSAERSPAPTASHRRCPRADRRPARSTLRSPLSESP
jgi:serine/threonine protein kinase